MNEHLQERFSRSRRGVRGLAHVLMVPPRLNPRIREYFDGAAAQGGHWLARPEVPSSAELMDLDTESCSSASETVELEPNKLAGAWETKEDYLKTHYELLREDAVRPLREAIARLRVVPEAAEDGLGGQYGIYEKVHICGVTFSPRGIAIRVTFSIFRAGKKILWEQSKRLLSGSMVALTPKEDMFQTKTIVAVIAARPLAGLQQNPPEIDLFFARAEEIEIDPAAEYVMLEDRSAFFEADRHVLSALQHMMKEPFPLAEHLVKAQTNVAAPNYVQTHPKTDLQTVLANNMHESYENVDILKAWPPQPESSLDQSQLSALKRVLTKRLAIIQGPPGTGKTHVSVQAIRVMLANRASNDKPIIIACQTNHAVDQILRHIAQFESDFARLGGRSKDQDVIKKRTLYELRQASSENPPAGCMKGQAMKKMSDIKKDLFLIITPLKIDEKKPLDHRVLEQFKLLTKAQADSLEFGASTWVQDRKSNPNEARSPFKIWLGDKLIPVSARQAPEDFGFDYEETDQEFEQLKEVEAETKDEEDFETLPGDHHAIADNWTTRQVTGVDNMVKDLLRKEQNMWKIPEASRGAIYRHLQVEVKKSILVAFREKAKLYNEQAKKRMIGTWEANENILQKQKIIGMTTTGLSKYRALISALEPKVVLIEEAAETLEAPATAACMPTLEHLILVGDHKQLRPHTKVKALENEPYFLNISLFERLVNNKVEYATLTKQRRMIPEIRRALYPIYGTLITDHPSVKNPDLRPDIRGMGGVNSFFFTHQYGEGRDDQMSCNNAQEADMIVGFVEYLFFNGASISDITILTFYNGQRKKILAILRRNPALEGNKFNVVTVDSYQGEENKIVILSLVRSNETGQIGFLNIDNRVCVALSRAQCGFYIFGNAMLLYKYQLKVKGSKPGIWHSVITILAGSDKRVKNDLPKLEPMRLAEKLPVRCSKHNTKTEIAGPEDWERLNGGCEIACGSDLSCGHPCTLRCHPFPHDMVNCQECRAETTESVPAMDGPSPSRGLGRCRRKLSRSNSPSTESESTDSNWQDFAEKMPQRVAEVRETYIPHSDRIHTLEATQLVDLDQLEVVTQSFRQLPATLDGQGTEHSDGAVTTGDGNGTRLKWKDSWRINGSGPVSAPNSVPNRIQDWSKQSSLLD